MRVVIVFFLGFYACHKMCIGTTQVPIKSTRLSKLNKFERFDTYRDGAP